MLPRVHHSVLVIRRRAPETVKRHTANIDQKLEVHGRREAVEGATSLGVLQVSWLGTGAGPPSPTAHLTD